MRALPGAVLLLAVLFPAVAASAPAPVPTYPAYLEAHAGAEEPDLEVVVPADAFTRDSVGVTIVRGLGGFAGVAAVTGETGRIEWDVTVPAAGFYSIEVSCYPLEGRGSTIEREILVNSGLPFDGARYLTFSRVWADAMAVRKDLDGNEIRAPQVERPRWQDVTLRDSQGYEPEPYRFFFAKGRNRIALVSISEPMAVRRLRLFRAAPAPSHAEAIAEARARGFSDATGFSLTLEERDASAKSSPSLFPVFDQGDPSVVPYDPVLIRLNAIGGHLWRTPGEWVAWEFEVPADGLYLVGIKAKQDRSVASYSTRRMLVDGVVPFAEAEAMRFPFSSTYRMYSPEADGAPLAVPLARGRHELRLEVTLGDLADVLRDTESVLLALNAVYRQIIVVTSPTPDPLRTYQLGERIPATLEAMGTERDRLLEIADRLEERTGQKGGSPALLRRMALLIDRMRDDPDLIPGLLGEFRDNTAALGAWINETRDQRLLVDSVTIASPDRGLPAVRSGVGRVLLHEIRAFIASFTHDYRRIGSMSGAPGGSRTIKVWLSSGRNQAQILKGMIEDIFTPATGIAVDLELVETLGQTLRDTVMGNLLIPSLIAGKAPDVALGAANMDLAFRGAAVDLAAFPDFAEVATRFKASAFVPFRFRESVYALPEVQSFPVLFYRQDILDELGLAVPRTWDEVHRLIPVLHRANMEFGMAPDMGSYLMLLYQKGVPFFKEDSVATNLDSEAAVSSLIELTEYYTLYGLSLAYDAANRFVLGEMPLVIAEYGLYNLLTQFAPQLRGQWGFAVVPGTPRADGTVAHTVALASTIAAPGSLVPPPGATGAMILAPSKNRDAAWSFLKWWTEADTQARFGREMESLLGSATRYATANVEALQRLPWRAEQRRVLNEQWDWTEGIPSVPGAYYVNRVFSWLLRAVVIENEPVRESVLRYDRDINEEIARKRTEFGLPTRLADVERRWRDAWWSQFTHLERPAGGAP